MSVEYKTPILSYANQAMPLHQRFAIRSLEQVTGRGPLYRRYRQYQKASRQTVAGVAQWDLAVETLGIYDTQVPVPNLPKPRDGRGLLLVANHPYGILDGVLLAWLASRIDADFRVIAIGVLCAEPSLNPNILPISFDPDRESLRQNVTTRQSAIKHLKRGNIVAIFPAGAVSWARQKHTAVEDEDWKPMAGKLINASGCDVLPVRFHGANSGLYQFFSRHMMSIRPGLYLRELKKSLDQQIDFSIGEVIKNEDLPELSDHALARYLRPFVENLR